jgi:hypothetical protein
MKPTSILSTIIGAALAMSAMAANAVSIRVTDGTAANTFTCADGAACDTNPVAGVVSFNTSVGTVWTTAGGTGFGPNLVPGLTLDLNAFQLSTTAGGTIQVLVSQDGFTNDSVSQFIAIGGTSDGTIQMRGYAGAGLFDLTTLLADTGILGGNPFSGSASSGTLVKGPYSLTI